MESTLSRDSYQKEKPAWVIKAQKERDALHKCEEILKPFETSAQIRIAGILRMLVEEKATIDKEEFEAWLESETERIKNFQETQIGNDTPWSDDYNERVKERQRAFREGWEAGAWDAFDKFDRDSKEIAQKILKKHGFS